MPCSKMSRCSGSTIPDWTMCRSWTRAGSQALKPLARQSACFWLSPSRQTRSPGSSTASSRSTTAEADTTLPSAWARPRSIRASLAFRCTRQSAIRSASRHPAPHRRRPWERAASDRSRTVSYRAMRTPSGDQVNSGYTDMGYRRGKEYEMAIRRGLGIPGVLGSSLSRLTIHPIWDEGHRKAVRQTQAGRGRRSWTASPRSGGFSPT